MFGFGRGYLPGFYFDADKGTGGGGGEGDPPGEGEPPEGTGDGTGGQEPQNAGDDKVEFSPEQQAHVDKIIGDRLARARAQWEKDVEKARQEAEKARKGAEKKAEAEKARQEKEAEEARLAEEKKWAELADKRQQEIADLQVERDRLVAEAEAEQKRALAALVDLRIRHTVEIQAARMGFIDPEDAYNLVDLSGVEVAPDEDGGEVKGVEEALKKLAEDKPYLVGGEDGKKVPGTPQSRSPNQKRPAGRPEQPRRVTL